MIQNLVKAIFYTEGKKDMMRRKHSAIILMVLILAALSVLPVSGAMADTGTVKGGWLILRADPSFTGAIKASYPSGTVVTITGQVGSWYAVTTPDGLTGYMLGDYLQIGGSGKSNPATGTFIDSTAYVTSANGLNVRMRSGPGKGYSVIASYVPGTKCTIISPGNNWCRIQVGNLTGYMMTQFLTGTEIATPVTPVPAIVPSGSEYTVYVTSRNGNGVNLRSGPAKSYTSIGFYSVGTQATMITKGTTWSYIRVGNRYGYMMTEFLTESQTVAPVPSYTGAYVVSANGRNVNLRSAPSTQSNVLRSCKIGTPLTVITRGVDWCFVLIDGTYGYMMRQFIYDGSAPATTTDLYPYGGIL